jgi:hypothetical protein
VPLQRPQGLPEGYFDAFSERLMARIADEEASATLAALPHTQPALPVGYFDDLEDRVQARIIEEEAQASLQALSGLSKAAPALPPGYFDQLAGQVQARIADAQAADFLTQLPKVPSSVPEGYFETLEGRVIARVQAASPVQTASREGKRVQAGWWRPARIWAAAAVLVLALTTTLLVLRGSRPITPDTYAIEQSASAALKVQLASLENDAVVGALRQASVSDDEIFAVMGADGFQDLELGEAVQDDAAADYLDDANVDDLDLEGLDFDNVDLSDITL